MGRPKVEVERVEEMTPKLAEILGAQMPDLSERFTGEALDLDHMTEVVDSPDNELVIAQIEGKIVGSAIFNLMRNKTIKIAYLHDNVVDEELRGMGVGHAIFEEYEAWAEERGADELEFTSSDKKSEFHPFYFQHGAEIRPTNVFQKEL